MNEEEFLMQSLYIWEKVPKTKEGFIKYIPNDLPYLYHNGFVDTKAHTYEQWVEAFQPCKQEDGTYLIDRDHFLNLTWFRPRIVGKPFDPFKVPEKEWTDEHLGIMYKLRIYEGSEVSEDTFWKVIEALKKKGHQKNGNLYFNGEVKTTIFELIERFPSPARRLQKAVAEIRKKEEDKFRKGSATKTKSQFVSGQFESEKKLESFQQLQSKSAPIEEPEIDESKTVDLKSLRRHSKKIGV